MLNHLDHGVSQADSIVASKDVNGYVAIENLNGLDVRLQSVVYLQNILLDSVELSNSTSITFSWRRKTQKEVALDANGHAIMIGSPPHPKMMFYLTQHTINVALDRQTP
jgi:hypothetical protein